MNLWHELTKFGIGACVLIPAIVCFLWLIITTPGKRKL
jgi:hypothetical protein